MATTAGMDETGIPGASLSGTSVAPPEDAVGPGFGTIGTAVGQATSRAADTLASSGQAADLLGSRETLRLAMNDGLPKESSTETVPADVLPGGDISPRSTTSTTIQHNSAVEDVTGPLAVDTAYGLARADGEDRSPCRPSP